MSVPLESAPGLPEIAVTRCGVDEILPLREFHREEMNCQIVHDSFPLRGLSDAFLVRVDGQIAGYGLVANRYYPDTVNEFFVVSAHRGRALPIFRRLLEVSRATSIRAQTNDPLLLCMLYDCAGNIVPENVLFADSLTTSLPCPGGDLRKRENREQEEWAIEMNGKMVASGGILFHYNPPYGDIFMNVEEAYRRRGLGSFVVQELKRICYAMGKVPAARCDADNLVSRRTLERAGMLPCGRVLQGKVLR